MDVFETGRAVSTLQGRPVENLDAAFFQTAPETNAGPYRTGIQGMRVFVFMVACQNLGSGICGKNQQTIAISVTKNTTMQPTIKPCRFCSGVVNGGA
ncbi:hypothetical protein [Komagataeibacter europaeus]|nr:hypothetical protein [Komagataeibacter europaeus]